MIELQNPLIKAEKEYLEYSLTDYIPYVDFVDNKIFFDNGTAAIIFKLNFVYDDIISDDGLCMMDDSLITFLNNLEKDVKIQFLFKKTKYFDDIITNHLNENESNNELIKVMFRKRVEKIQHDLKHNLLFRYSLYFVITKKYDFQINNSKSFWYSFQKMNAAQQQIYQNVYSDLLEIEETYSLSLKKTGFLVTPLVEQETIDAIASQINATEIRNIDFRIKQDLLYSGIVKEYDHLKVSNKYIRIITFKSNRLPQSLHFTIIKSLIRADLRFEYDIVVNLKINDKPQEIRELERKRLFTRAVKKNFFSNAEDQEKVVLEQNIEKLLVDLTNNSENIFSFEFLILVKGQSIKELNKNCKDILLSINHMNGAVGLAEDMPNMILYLNPCQIGNTDFNNKRTDKLWSSRMTCLLPIFGPPEGVGEPLMLLRNQYSSLTYYNPLSARYLAKNGIVIGSTGSGKSFLMNMITLGYFAKDPVLIIVDIGGSYKKMIEMFEGDYFELSFEYSINPFTTQNPEKRELFWKAILQVMIRDETKRGVSNNEKFILEKTIARVIEKGINNPIISDFVEAMMELEVDENLVLLKAELARHLELWTHGKKGDLLNQRQSTLNISKNIIGFDLKGLKDYPEIMEVVMFYLANVVWEKAEAERDRKKLIIFDEVWQQFLSKQGSELLEDLYRTIRKYNGSIWSVSQGIEDFSNSDVATAILQNIQFFYIMEQASGTNFEELGKILNLNPVDLVTIKNLKSVKGKFAESFIKTPELKLLARIVPSPFEYWLATTDGDDMTAYKKTLKNFDGELIKTIEHLSEKYPNGAFK